MIDTKIIKTVNWPTTARGRGIFALTGVWFMLATIFGTLQWVTGGGWWGYLLWTGVALYVAALIYVVPRVMRWIDAGKKEKR